MFISKLKYGIFVIVFYKKDFFVNDFIIWDCILDVVCDVVNYVLELEEVKGNGMDRKFNYINYVVFI